MAHALSPRTKNALRTVHSLAACGWLGGGLAVLVVLKLAGAPEGHDAAVAFQRSIIAIDDYLIIPSAGLATLSGLAISSAKPWGFSEHRWIRDKCLLTTLLLIFGAFWLEPDLQSLVPGVPQASETYPAYYTHWLHGSAAAVFQTLGLLLLVGLSILKPEKPTTAPRAAKRTEPGARTGVTARQ